jgi:hypothetical protein
LVATDTTEQATLAFLQFPGVVEASGRTLGAERDVPLQAFSMCQPC